MKGDGIAKLVELCLRIANIVDDNGGYCNGEQFNEDIGLGYKAFTGYLRKGAKAVIDLQASYYSALDLKRYAEIGEKEALDLIEDIFGDRDAVTLPDSYKEEFRALLKKLDEDDNEEVH
ncbi:MAG: hypothetical protein LUI12_05110 [Clostridiales bacterium]|nr:hypothetical protein [Clostridiales bacterium]